VGLQKENVLIYSGLLMVYLYLTLFACLFICLQPPEQFFSYLMAVTITRDKAANLDLHLAHMAFSGEGSFLCHTYCGMGPRFIRSNPKDVHPE
jgi:hypothetical protein